MPVAKREGKMRRLVCLISVLMAVSPAGAAAQYEAPANPADPAAQLAEVLAVYDAACLRAFPDDEAVAREMTARGASPLSAREVRIFLHDDPGRGWRIDGRTGPISITIEAPPYHACGVRTMTAEGFADMGPYRALADRFEQGGGFQTIPAVSLDHDNLRISAGGERRLRPEGGSQSLLVILTTPAEGHRDHGQTAVEVRFVHQLAR
jgi:hypothetical protein